MIRGKHIVLGVTGGIAAYKACYLASRLTQLGADVRVCMTANACRFVTPLTFESLTHNAVITDTFSRETPTDVSHIALEEWADIAVIAPATADVMGKAACGICDDFLTTFLMAFAAPVLYAPAMNTHMYENAAFKENMEKLVKRGAYMIEPAIGMLACGTVGKGRMAEPDEIIAAVDAYFARGRDLEGKRIVVSAGATIEDIDCVRYITNRSTGRMGCAIAKAAARRGADVVLIKGESVDGNAGDTVTVRSADDMFGAVMKHSEGCDAVIMAAAVADYTPAKRSETKIKKSGDISLELVRTKDILNALGQDKKGRILVGFAAESNDVEKYAREKLERKNLDMIVANDISRADIGFKSAENEVTIYMRSGEARHLDKDSKEKIADILLDCVKEMMEVNNA